MPAEKRGLCLLRHSVVVLAGFPSVVSLSLSLCVFKESLFFLMSFYSSGMLAAGGCARVPFRKSAEVCDEFGIRII